MYARCTRWWTPTDNAFPTLRIVLCFFEMWINLVLIVCLVGGGHTLVRTLRVCVCAWVSILDRIFHPHICSILLCISIYIYYIYSYMLHVSDTYIRLCVNAEKEKKWSGSWYFCTVSVHYAWHYGKRKKIAFHAIIANYSNRQCRYSNLDQAANLTPLHIIELQQNTFNICLKATTKIVLFSYRK